MDSVLELIGYRVRFLFSVEMISAIGLSLLGARIFNEFNIFGYFALVAVAIAIGEFVRRRLGRKSLLFYDKKNVEKQEEILELMRSEPNIQLWRIAYLLELSQGQTATYIIVLRKTGCIENTGTRKNPQWVVK